MSSSASTVGRFAPSPSGRMHLGNVFSALLSWLSVRAASGSWILRIEDLDPQRSKREHALRIQDDLHWLGLDWDLGGIDAFGPDGNSFAQSQRSHIYAQALDKLVDAGLTYPCRCTRADLHATQAPHASDGILIYPGTCRPGLPPYPKTLTPGCATRIYLPDQDLTFTDRVFGTRTVNLARDCGDFLLRRADGAFAYQLAVTVDDALMGVTEVVRGVDLLLSSPRQIYLYRLLGFQPPQFAHVPLICNAGGVRLSKRDNALSLESLRTRCSPEQIIGHLAFAAGIIDRDEPVTAAQLIPLFDWRKIIPRQSIIIESF